MYSQQEQVKVVVIEPEQQNAQVKHIACSI